MYGIFVNERGAGRYATWLANGSKTIETRSRDMLSALVGQRVAIVKTHRDTISFCEIPVAKRGGEKSFQKGLTVLRMHGRIG